MSYSSMTLKKVMGGCELIDLKTPKFEKPLFIDLSLIGVDLIELQKTLNRTMSSHSRVHIGAGSPVTAGSGIIEEYRGVQSKDNNKDICSSPENIMDDELMISSFPRVKPAKVDPELFDLNANKIVDGKSCDLPQPVYTSLQNFYETFDVSDQVESMSVMDYSANTPSSVSTFDSSYELQDLVIYEEHSIVDYRNRYHMEAASSLTSFKPITEEPREYHFIPIAVNPQNSITYDSILTQEITKSVKAFATRGGDDKSNETLHLKVKRRKINGGRVSKRKQNSAEKTISCSMCSKKFRTAAHLKVHFMVHMDSECMHRCTICERRFCHRGALTLHARKHASKPAFL